MLHFLLSGSFLARFPCVRTLGRQQSFLQGKIKKGKVYIVLSKYTQKKKKKKEKGKRRELSTQVIGWKVEFTL